jgi:cytochrome c biogenesis protein CcdA/thiol-disulfide isomerase/thioredoxin
MISLIGTLFVAGLLTVLLPCILPLIPIVLGVSIADRNKWKPLVTTLGMIISFVGSTFLLQVVLSQFVELADYIHIATFYILLLFGLGFLFHTRTPQLLGALVGSIFFIDKGWIAVIIAAVLGVIAMETGSRVASRIQQFGTDVQTKTRSSFGANSLISAFIIGLTIGLVWVPCAGPALGFAFSLVRDEPGLKAFIALTAYGVGAGIPLLLIGYGGQRAVHSARVLSQYSGVIKQVSGALLIISAVGFHLNIFQDAQTWLVNNTAFGRLGTGIEESLFGGTTDTESVSNTDGALPIEAKAPDNFPGLSTWHNSKPLAAADLKGKVVLVDFWTYSCINCIRTLPYIEALAKKYADAPFVLLGVHTPEFVFEKSPANMAKAIKDHGLTYPVAQDNEYETWNAFDNHYWPAKYLIDAEGNIRYHHFGEGGYDETDAAIASLLKEIGYTGSGSGVMPEEVQKEQKPVSPETYLHSRSWKQFGNQQDRPSDEVITYDVPASMRLHYYYLVGTWQLVDDERQVLRSSEGEIRYHARAGEVNLVLGVEKEGEPVQADVFVDGKKTKTITIDHHDLYQLYKGDYGEHEVILKIHGAGLEGYAFTFGV